MRIRIISMTIYVTKITHLVFLAFFLFFILVSCQYNAVSAQTIRKSELSIDQIAQKIKQRQQQIDRIRSYIEQIPRTSSEQTVINRNAGIGQDVNLLNGVSFNKTYMELVVADILIRDGSMLFSYILKNIRTPSSLMPNTLLFAADSAINCATSSIATVTSQNPLNSQNGVAEPLLDSAEHLTVTTPVLRTENNLIGVHDGAIKQYRGGAKIIDMIKQPSSYLQRAPFIDSWCGLKTDLSRLSIMKGVYETTAKAYIELVGTYEDYGNGGSLNGYQTHIQRSEDGQRSLYQGISLRQVVEETTQRAFGSGTARVFVQNRNDLDFLPGCFVNYARVCAENAETEVCTTQEMRCHEGEEEAQCSARHYSSSEIRNITTLGQTRRFVCLENETDRTCLGRHYPPVPPVVSGKYKTNCTLNDFGNAVTLMLNTVPQKTEEVAYLLFALGHAGQVTLPTSSAQQALTPSSISFENYDFAAAQRRSEAYSSLGRVFVGENDPSALTRTWKELSAPDARALYRNAGVFRGKIEKEMTDSITRIQKSLPPEYILLFFE